MANTDDLDRLVGLARAHHWRLVLVGDPAQLPAVGKAGMFAHLCETLRVHQLEEVRRFQEHWQAEASLALRRGDPEAARSDAAHGQLASTHPAMVADRVALAFERLSSDGSRVVVTTASAGVARAINTEI
jgi:ATP-dependent exoDNAse (exonuclease V) alpha subunit